MSSLPQLDRVLLADRAYDGIKDAILAGDIAAGTKLTEAGVAEQMGVSRVPVREALQRLKGDGLIEDMGQRGMQVRRLTGTDIVDIYNFRLGLEPVAARLVALNGAPPQQLDRRIEEMTAAADAQDSSALSTAELAFHQDLCDLSGNRLISSSFARVAALIKLAIVLDNLHYVDVSHAAEEHHKVVDALRSGDPDLAGETMIEHILSTVDEVVTALEGDSGEDGGTSRLAWSGR